MIPDDDRHVYPRVDQDSLAPIHQDVTVTSRLLNLIVSFRWRPLIDDHVTRDIAQWLETASTTLSLPDANYPPDFILISLYYFIDSLKTLNNNLEEVLKPNSIRYRCSSHAKREWRQLPRIRK